MTLYNLKSALDDYRITKFTPDLDVESSYLIGGDPVECECPAGTRPTCRHRQMLPDLLPLVDTEFFWDFERRTCVNSDGIACDLTTVTVVPEANPTKPTIAVFLDDPQTLHNVIAAAVGEPAIDVGHHSDRYVTPRTRPQTGNWRRI